MMFCPHCGAPNNDTAVFCMKCGYRVAAEPLQQPAQPTIPSAIPTPPAAPPVQPPIMPPTAPAFSAIPVDPVQHTTKRLIASPLFLVAAILLSVTLLFSLFSVFSVSTSLSAWSELIDLWSEEYASGMEVEEELLSETVSGFSGIFTVVGLIGLIPTGLLVAGLWMLFACAKNPVQPRLKTTGLSLIKGVSIYQLVMMALTGALVVLLAVLLLLVAAAGFSTLAGTDENMFAIGFTVILIALAFLGGLVALYIVFYVKAIRLIGSVVNTLNTGIPSSRVSMFVIVMCFVQAALTMGSSLFMAVAYVLFGILLLQYRNAMQQLEMAMMMPTAPVSMTVEPSMAVPMAAETPASKNNETLPL